MDVSISIENESLHSILLNEFSKNQCRNTRQQKSVFSSKHLVEQYLKNRKKSEATEEEILEFEKIRCTLLYEWNVKNRIVSEMKFSFDFTKILTSTIVWMGCLQITMFEGYKSVWYHHFMGLIWLFAAIILMYVVYVFVREKYFTAEEDVPIGYKKICNFNPIQLKLEHRHPSYTDYLMTVIDFYSEEVMPLMEVIRIYRNQEYVLLMCGITIFSTITWIEFVRWMIYMFLVDWSAYLCLMVLGTYGSMSTFVLFLMCSSFFKKDESDFKSIQR
ncbi:hypothetical protein CRE_30755 [Caenorhabditis remanei]|uniref:Uncharacterized protein n=1 Tax=Caenorhabditis remanei TaxID=31234 RepID=E3LU37_CAERE|nr:hypothetical protein CRE_30755 [Caenorhabditis remanei]